MRAHRRLTVLCFVFSVFLCKGKSNSLCLIVCVEYSLPALIKWLEAQGTFENLLDSVELSLEVLVPNVGCVFSQQCLHLAHRVLVVQYVVAKLVPATKEAVKLCQVGWSW